MNQASVSASDEDGSALEPGSVVKNRYVLGERIGRDRSGSLYEAVDTALSQTREHYVALQVLPPHVSEDPAQLERFKSELVELRSLSHPNIARILDLDADEHRYFVTMERLEGASVGAILDEVSSEPMSVDETLAIVRAVGDALMHAHDRGVVHGELGPDDVIVTADYEVKVLGFLRSREAFEPFGVGMRPAAADARDDVQALAQLAYALFANDRSITMGRNIAGSVKPGRLRGLSARQRKTLTRALAPAREQRPASVRDLLAGLEITGAETLADVVETEPRPTPARRRATTWLVAGAAGVLAAAAGVYYGAARFDATRAPEAPPASVSAPEGPPGAERPPETAPAADSAQGAAEDGLAMLDTDYEHARLPLAALAAERVPSADEPLADEPAADEPAALPELEPVPEQADAARDDGVSSTEPEARVAPEPIAEPEPLAEPEAAAEPRPERDAGSEQPQPAPASGAQPGATAFEFVDDGVTVRESVGTARLTVRRSGPISEEVSFVWWTVPGSADADEDYADLGRVEEVIAAGEREVAIFVPIASDSLPEPVETFEVRLLDTVSETNVSESTQRATVRIDDDDG